MHFSRHKNLRDYNTFHAQAIANLFVEIKSEKEALELIQTKEFQDNTRFVLGGGSNVLFTDDFQGLVITSNIKGFKFVESDGDYNIVESGSGESWHEFVEASTKNKYYGIENLALIPGKVGAAPVQNIGAYGVEQSDFFHSLRGVDFNTGEIRELNKEECEFYYRGSVFKNKLKDSFLITSVRYRLPRKWTVNRTYKELDVELNKFSFINVDDPMYVFNTVCRIRKQKMPDMTQYGNAGSFFMNPVVDKNFIENNDAKLKGAPIFKMDENKFKIAAAWLIEQAGWKGRYIGDAGVYERHALLLVNKGFATGNEIMQLSNKIIADVNDKFGVILEREVVIV